MNTQRQPAIARLVAHHGGPSALSKKLGGTPVYQEVQRWVRRGWASPMQIFKLEPLLLEGMVVRDLHEDREKAKVVASVKRPVPRRAAGTRAPARA